MHYACAWDVVLFEMTQIQGTRRDSAAQFQTDADVAVLPWFTGPVFDWDAPCSACKKYIVVASGRQNVHLLKLHLLTCLLRYSCLGLRHFSPAHTASRWGGGEIMAVLSVVALLSVMRRFVHWLLWNDTTRASHKILSDLFCVYWHNWTTIK